MTSRTTSSNPFGEPFHLWPPEVMEAYKDLPQWNQKNAPFTEEFRDKYRVWAKKWKDRGVPLWPHMVEAYKALDRAKNLSRGSRAINGVGNASET